MMKKSDRERLRVAIYARQSTVHQDHSVEDQEKILLAKAVNLGFTVVRRYHEKKSGASIDERTEFNSLLEDAKKGIFDILMAYDVSRITREGAIRFFWILAELLKYGVRVYDFESDRFLKESDAIDLCNQAHQALKENEKRSRDISRGILFSVQDRKSDPGRRVYGYDRVYVDERGSKYNQVHLLPDGTKLILDPQTGEERGRLRPGEKYAKTRSHQAVLVPGHPDEVAVVILIFLLARAGVSANSIANKLNADGVPGPRGKKWNTSTIRHILSNEAYVGHIIFNRRQEGRYYDIHPDCPRIKEESLLGRKTLRHKPSEEWIIHKNAHEPIISQDKFDAVQALLRSRTGKRRGTPRSKRVYLLSGLIRCRRCGGVLHGHTNRAGKNGYEYRQYVCSTPRKYGTSECGHYKVDATGLDAVALDRIRGLLGNPGTREAIRLRIESELATQGDAVTKTRQLKGELAEVEKLRESLAANLKPGQVVFMAPEIDKLMTRHGEISAEINALVLQQNVTADPSVVASRCLALFDNVVAGIGDACRVTVRDLLRDLGLHATYDPDRKEVRLWFDPFFLWAADLQVGLKKSTAGWRKASPAVVPSNGRGDRI